MGSGVDNPQRPQGGTRVTSQGSDAVSGVAALLQAAGTLLGALFVIAGLAIGIPIGYALVPSDLVCVPYPVPGTSCLQYVKETNPYVIFGYSAAGGLAGGAVGLFVYRALRKAWDERHASTP